MPSEGLRTRRRRETAHEIHAAAVRLISEHGFDKVTIEMISAGAGISQRTFFNYFPSKESAVAHRLADFTPEQIARFMAGTGDRPREVLADTTRLVLEHVRDNLPDRQDSFAVFRIADECPPVLAAVLAQLDGFRARLTEVVAGRSEPEQAELLAGIALTALRTGFDHWSHQPPRPPPRTAPTIPPAPCRAGVRSASHAAWRT